MYPGETTHYIFPFAHGSVLALSDHSKLLAIGLPVFEVVDVLLYALFRQLALKLTRGALGINVRKLVLINAGCRLLQETPLTAAVDGRLPLSQPSGIGQCEGNSVVLVAGAGKDEHGGETEAEKVVTPLICCVLVELLTWLEMNIPSIISSPSMSPPRISVSS